MIIFKLAWKFLKRELLQGDLSLLFIAIVIAISSLSTIGFLLKRIDRSMLTHAAQLNGAELILKSPTAIPEHWIVEAKKQQLNQASMISFPSMLVVNNQFKLAQIKAVSDNFPLLGKLLVKPYNEKEVQQKNAPESGNIWIDRRLYHSLKISENKQLPIELGEAVFNYQGILESVPGQSSSFFKLAPGAIININDLDKTATITAGSRVDYIYFFSGPEPALTQYQTWLKSKIKPGQSLRYGVEGIRAVSNNLNKANKFLSLAALLSVLLSAIAIIISSYRYGQQQYKNNATLLCLGLSETKVIQLEFIKLILLGFIASIIGLIIGFLIHLLLLEILSELIPKPYPPLSFLPVWMGLGSGLLLIISLSSANLLGLKQLTPMAILRKDLLTISLNHYVLYGMSSMGLLLLSWLYSQDLYISVLFYALMIGTLVILFFCSKILLHFLLIMAKRLSWIPRLALINLHQHQSMALLQITTFSLIFALVLISYLVRSDLLYQWQQQLPTDTPNHFIINIQDYETVAFKKVLSENTISSSDIFPMVRGRLSWLNDKPIKNQLSTKQQNHNALNRELNLSFASVMQTHNQLVEGAWWDANQASQDLAQISLESSLANELGIIIGDKLGFQIGSRQIQGVVSNLRRVKWDSFKPNFYVIFSPGSLDSFPLTYISSFYVPAKDKLILNQLIEHFPGITIIEVDQIIKEVQYIIDKIALAINFVFIFILMAGLLVLASSLSSTLESRLYESAIIRTLGASAKKIRHGLLTEFSIIAIISALSALIMAETISAILYQQIFKLSYSFHPWLWLIMIVIALIMILSMSLLIINKIFNQSVNHSLRQFGR